MKNISEKKRRRREKEDKTTNDYKKKKKKSRRHARLPGEGEGGVNRAVDKEKRVSYLGAMMQQTRETIGNTTLKRKKLAHETGERDSCASKCSSWLGNDELEGLEARFAVACHTIARFDHSKP